MDDTNERILRIKEVMARTGLKRTTLYAKINQGTFPRQLQISERCTGWRQSEVERWLRDPMGYRSDTDRNSGG
jgi:prophage regulatory protein